MVELLNIDFSYKRAKVFDSLTLSLKEGNIYGLLGKNGAGKTTLLKIISGLLFPVGGKVDVGGFIPKAREPDFLKDIFYLPEEYSLPGMSILKYKNLYAPFYPDFDGEKFKELLEEFQLLPDQILSSISYGQKKKFLVSFGIACNSRIFLLDEPTNGLDIPSKTQFRKIIASVGTENRLIIISTHQVRDVENLIDPIVIIDNGKVIFNYSMEDVTDKLTVTKMSKDPVGGDFLYSEQELDGYKVVVENVIGEQGEIDLETLFNTVAASPDKVGMLFKGENHYANR